MPAQASAAGLAGHAIVSALIERAAILERSLGRAGDVLRGIPGVRVLSRHLGSGVEGRAGGRTGRHDRRRA